jgi:hypothetical protein
MADDLRVGLRLRNVRTMHTSDERDRRLQEKEERRLTCHN